MRSRSWALAASALLLASIGWTGTAGAARAGAWSPTELTASDGAARDGFGTSVAISGKTAIVGAPSHSSEHGPGAAYVFGLGSSGWTQQAELPAPAPSDLVNYGASVAIDGNVAVVGAISDRDRAHAGAYVFVRAKGRWKERAHLHAIAGLAGFSVAISGDTIVVGAPQLRNLRNTKYGATYVYQQVAGQWPLQATLTDPTEPPDYGYHVAIDGDTIVVGAPHESGGPQGAGSAYTYRRAGTTWTPDGMLQATTPQDNDGFGASVAISGGTVIVGAYGYLDIIPGAAYIFTGNGSGWTPASTLTDARHQYFGSQVAISGNRAIVGFDPGSRAGDEFVYLYRLQNGVAVGRKKLAPTDAGDTDEFGAAVAISGARAIVGAYGHTVDGAAGAGAAYVFAP
jgi:hypothetical protein